MANILLTCKLYLAVYVRKKRIREGVKPLINRGLTIEKNFQFEKGMLIDKIYPHLITIGDDVIFSADVKILAHDAGLRNIMGIVRIGHVTIGNRVFVGLGTKILPNVTIGDDVIIGAGSVVSRNLPAGTVCAGSPARVLCTLDEYKNRILCNKEEYPIYEFDKDPLKMTKEEKENQKEELKSTIGLKKAVNYKLFNSLEEENNE